jgi:hypothetical protein
MRPRSRCGLFSLRRLDGDLETFASVDEALAA